MKHDCDGNPSLTNYGRGCSCDLCRSVKSLYEQERRERARKNGVTRSDSPAPKKPAGKRDQSIVYHDAFTREQILEARANG